MKYRVLEVSPMRWKIYDIELDIFHPKNFIKPTTAREYLYKTVLDPALPKRNKTSFLKKTKELTFD